MQRLWLIPCFNCYVNLLNLLKHVSCLQVQSHCDPIVASGGLQLLQRVYQLRRDSLKIQRNIVRIIGNLAVNDSVHQAIVQSGKSVTHQMIPQRFWLCVILTGDSEDAIKNKIYILLLYVLNSSTTWILSNPCLYNRSYHLHETSFLTTATNY